MAKCRVCGKIWSCSGEGVEMYYLEDGEEYQHCGTCRCDECRKDDKTPVTVEGKALIVHSIKKESTNRKITTIKQVDCPIDIKDIEKCKKCIWYGGMRVGEYVICKR